MKRALRAIVLLAALRAAPALAGEQVVEVDGQAATTSADPKVAARDDAFAAALQAALPTLAPADVLAARRAEVARDIIGRARRFVSRYTVSAERDEGGAHVLHAAVTVDLGKVVDALHALGITEAVEPTAVTAPVPRGTSRATLLMRVISADGVAASYGALATRLSSGAAVEAELVRRGWKVVAPPASGPAAGPTGELPLERDAARALAGDSRAAIAVVVGVNVTEPGRVRGVLGAGVAARAWAAVVRTDGSDDGLVATAVGSAVGDAGTDLATQAVTRAATAALADVAPVTRRAIATTAPTVDAATDAGALRVTLRGGSWATVRAVRAALAARKGVSLVEFRRISATDVVLVVTSSESAAALARATKAVAGVRRAADADGAVTAELD